MITILYQVSGTKRYAVVASQANTILLFPFLSMPFYYGIHVDSFLLFPFLSMPTNNNGCEKVEVAMDKHSWGRANPL